MESIMYCSIKGCSINGGKYLVTSFAFFALKTSCLIGNVRLCFLLLFYEYLLV